MASQPGSSVRAARSSRRARFASDCRNASSWAEVRAARAHELHFVEHPLRVLVEEGELHRPECARRGVAAHQCTTEQHVLGADEHRRTLRVVEPAAGVRAAQRTCTSFGRGGGTRCRCRLRASRTTPGRHRRSARPGCASAGTRPAAAGCGRGSGCGEQPSRASPRRSCRSRRRNQHARPRIDRQRELPRVRLHVLAEHDSIDGGAVHGISWREQCDGRRIIPDRLRPAAFVASSAWDDSPRGRLPVVQTGPGFLETSRGDCQILSVDASPHPATRNPIIQSAAATVRSCQSMRGGRRRHGHVDAAR